MSNRLGVIATLGILGVGTLGIWTAPLASAHTDCVMDGPRICAPGNDRRVPVAGCYDEGGVLVALWPCEGNQRARWGVGVSSPKNFSETDQEAKLAHDDDGCGEECQDYEDAGHHGGGGHHHHSSQKDRELNHRGILA